MKKIALMLVTCVVLISVLLSFVACKNTVKNVPKGEMFNSEGYEVTFEDDFSGDKLDATKWRFFNGKVKGVEQYFPHSYRGGYYSDDEDIVYLQDGNLHISTKYKNGRYGEGWYSSWIETSTLDDEIRCFDQSEDYVGFAQQYGYFEVRCIAPPAEGLWSAFWLLPDEGKGLTNEDIQWSAEDGAEIDVMESQNYVRNKSYCQHVVHADYTPDAKGVLRSDKSYIYNVKDMYTQFHTYAVEWTPDDITFYIDGYKTYTTKVVYDKKVLGTPKVPSCLLLSVEIAGYSDENGLHVGVDKDGKKHWVGTLDNMDKDKSYDFIVDYVKVMQKKA